jgi:tetratricopeptide (TPR) repeat protein
MLMGRLFFLVLFACTVGLAHGQTATLNHPEGYERALELIHAFSGSGNNLQQAAELADALSQTHPNGGYVETLQAEILSTWRLDQQGQPSQLLQHIIGLTDRAIGLNPRLAQAHVARARALLRASDYGEANKAIDAALMLESNQSGAMFLRAEFFRRTFRAAEAEIWYLKFIELIPSAARKSNGYYWLGKAYQEVAAHEPTDRPQLISKARIAFEKMLELDPNGAWKNVNFAIFLNSDADDFKGAELYAQKALNIMEFPMARYHLALARYQMLLKPMESMDDAALLNAVQQVDRSTGIPIEEAIQFSTCCLRIATRLQPLQTRLRGKK